MTREEAIKILDQRFDSSCRNNLFQNVEKLDYEDALWMAISALRSTPHPGKPLTLDQLREMDGQPVWIVEYPDWGHWELSEDANDYIVDRNLNFYGMKHDDPDGRYGLHKLGWLAYSYPPAQQRWIPVSERLPEYNPGAGQNAYWIAKKNRRGEWEMKIALYCDYGYAMSVDVPSEVTWRDYDYCKITNVTHWMPLPKPPEEG